MRPALNRRKILKLSTAFALLPMASGTRLLAASSAFVGSDVDQMAAELSRQPFMRPIYTPPAPLNGFGYDEYRDIRFRHERAVWADENTSNMSLQFFLASFIYKDAIDVFLVDGGQSQHIEARREMFDFGLSDGKVPRTGEFAFSGFRVHGALNRINVNDEIAAFNGASYFRALARPSHNAWRMSWLLRRGFSGRSRPQLAIAAVCGRLRLDAVPCCWVADRVAGAAQAAPCRRRASSTTHRSRWWAMAKIA